MVVDVGVVSDVIISIVDSPQVIGMLPVIATILLVVAMMLLLLMWRSQLL